VRRRGKRRLLFAHQVDDPYGLQLAQVLPRLSAHVDVNVLIVPGPGEQVSR
jgi:hypothetical protein